MYSTAAHAERFVIEKCTHAESDDCWAFKDEDGNYIAARPDEGKRLQTHTNVIGPWEKFSIIPCNTNLPTKVPLRQLPPSRAPTPTGSGIQ